MTHSRLKRANPVDRRSSALLEILARIRAVGGDPAPKG